MSSRKSGSNGIGKLVGVKGHMPTNSDDITGPKIERFANKMNGIIFA